MLNYWYNIIWDLSPATSCLHLLTWVCVIIWSQEWLSIRYINTLCQTPGIVVGYFNLLSSIYGSKFKLPLYHKWLYRHLLDLHFIGAWLAIGALHWNIALAMQTMTLTHRSRSHRSKSKINIWFNSLVARFVVMIIYICQMTILCKRF